MSTESFHQALKGLAAKTIYSTQEATLATFSDSFVCIEPIPEFPGVAMIQAIYVAEKQRGKGIGKKLLMQLCQLAEAEQVVLAAYARPFEVKHPRKTVEQAATNFANGRKFYLHDPDGEKAGSMRRLLKGCSFENGFSCQSDPTKRSRYNLFWLFDNLHVYYPGSLGMLARYEFMENHRVDTERPAIRLLSLMNDDFDFVNDCTYKLRGRQAFVKISGIDDDAIYSSEVVRVAFAVGEDAELAIETLKSNAEKSTCCLVGILTPTPPAKKYKFDKSAYKNLLLRCGFNRHCPNEVLGASCCGFSDFQLLWMPSSVSPTVSSVVELLSPSLNQDGGHQVAA